MSINTDALDQAAARLDDDMLERIEEAVERIVAAKEHGGAVTVVTGSGPNIHEGVTTLIATLMRAGIVDAVSTSSAVVAHEMGGALDKVKRCPGAPLDLPESILPRGGEFELSVMDDATLDAIAAYMPVDMALIERLRAAEGKTIIKAAGNLGYPMGLYLERLSDEMLGLAHATGRSFEEVAGAGADARTMIGAGARHGLPVLVTVPQLIGGGIIGLNIGDSISVRERATRLARMLDASSVIIESAVALTQEVHDGPLETHTGHGLWSVWSGHYAYSLEGKSLIRIDLDPALEQVCRAQQSDGGVQQAIAEGLPKTKMFKVPFRMEMSGFARHDGSIPIIGDIGVVWPLLAHRVASRLGITLDFISYPQDTEAGRDMRERIVRDVAPINRDRMLDAARYSMRSSERVR